MKRSRPQGQHEPQDQHDGKQARVSDAINAGARHKQRLRTSRNLEDAESRANHTAPQAPRQQQADADPPCQFCHWRGGAAYMLLCEHQAPATGSYDCNKAYHTCCLEPPLPCVPSSGYTWLCPDCESARIQQVRSNPGALYYVCHRHPPPPGEHGAPSSTGNARKRYIASIRALCAGLQVPEEERALWPAPCDISIKRVPPRPDPKVTNAPATWQEHVARLRRSGMPVPQRDCSSSKAPARLSRAVTPPAAACSRRCSDEGAATSADAVQQQQAVGQRSPTASEQQQSSTVHQPPVEGQMAPASEQQPSHTEQQPLAAVQVPSAPAVAQSLLFMPAQQQGPLGQQPLPAERQPSPAEQQEVPEGQATLPTGQRQAPAAPTHSLVGHQHLPPTAEQQLPLPEQQPHLRPQPPQPGGPQPPATQLHQLHAQATSCSAPAPAAPAGSMCRAAPAADRCMDQLHAGEGDCHRGAGPLHGGAASGSGPGPGGPEQQPANGMQPASDTRPGACPKQQHAQQQEPYNSTCGQGAAGPQLQAASLEQQRPVSSLVQQRQQLPTPAPEQQQRRRQPQAAPPLEQPHRDLDQGRHMAAAATGLSPQWRAAAERAPSPTPGSRLGPKLCSAAVNAALPPPSGSAPAAATPSRRTSLAAAVEAAMLAAIRGVSAGAGLGEPEAEALPQTAAAPPAAAAADAASGEAAALRQQLAESRAEAQALRQQLAQLQAEAQAGLAAELQRARRSTRRACEQASRQHFRLHVDLWSNQVQVLYSELQAAQAQLQEARTQLQAAQQQQQQEAGSLGAALQPPAQATHDQHPQQQQ